MRVAQILNNEISQAIVQDYFYNSKRPAASEFVKTDNNDVKVVEYIKLERATRRQI